MSRPRRALLGAAGGAGLALALLTAGPAIAAASLSVTASNGQQVTVSAPQTSNDVLDVRGQLDPNTSTTQLVVTDPDGNSHVVASGSSSLTRGTTLSYALNTACLSYDPKQAPCSGSNPALNGVWTVSLQGGESATDQFALRIPPAAPQNVSASGASDGKTVTVTWQANTEPDLTGYNVLDGSGRVLAGDLSPAQVCNGGTCSTQVSAPGASSVAVDAQRASCPNCSQTLTSPPSAATVSWSSPSPAASPSGTPATSGSGSHGSTTTRAGSTGGRTTTGGRTAAGGQRGTAAGGTNAGALLQHLLPGPAAAAPPILPQPEAALPPGEAEPTVWGTYSPTLGYAPQTVGQLVTVPYRGGPRLAGAAPAAVSWLSPSLWRSVAEGLLLLLVAGHVAAWLRRSSAQ